MFRKEYDQEVQIKKKLKIKDWGKLSKSQIKKFAKMMHKINPEVLSKTLGYIIKFKENTIELGNWFVKIINELSDVDPATKAILKPYEKKLEYILKRLDKDNIKDEDRKEYEKMFDDAAQQIREIVNSGKKYKFKMLMTFSGVFAIFALIVGIFTIGVEAISDSKK